MNTGNVTRSEVSYPGQNRMSNISALANLASLSEVWRGVNEISDIYPLVRNYEPGTDHNVFLARNPLRSDCINTCIPQLEAAGVDVN